MTVKVEHVGGTRYRVRALVGRDPLTGKLVRRARYFHAPSKAKANKLGAEYEAELRREIAAGRLRREYVNGLIDDWWRDHEAVASPTTLHRERSIIDRIRQQLGSVRLDELTGQHIDRFYTHLRTAEFERPNGQPPRRLSESTIHHHHRILKAILRTGERWDRLAGDATRKAKAPRRPRPKVAPPTATEIAHLVANAGRYRTMFLFFAKTGCRRGEVCALRWSDLRGGIVEVSRSYAFVDGKTVEKDTKTNEPRKVTLDDDMQIVLRDWRAELEARAAERGAVLHQDARLFPDLRADPTGRVPRRPDTVSQTWRRLCAAHDVKARLHDLRHWNASILLASGVPVKAVSEHLGHSQTSTTMNIYAHTYGDPGITAALQKALPAAPDTASATEPAA